MVFAFKLVQRRFLIFCCCFLLCFFVLMLSYLFSRASNSLKTKISRNKQIVFVAFQVGSIEKICLEAPDYSVIIVVENIKRFIFQLMLIFYSKIFIDSLYMKSGFLLLLSLKSSIDCAFCICYLFFTRSE